MHVHVFLHACMQGNSHFKLGEYELALVSYSKAMELDPLSAVMPANRAMTHLKLDRLDSRLIVHDRV